jgi:branched-chain amino acid transport system ATP-binding protein
MSRLLRLILESRKRILMLEISGINVFYGDLQALWDVSLNIQEGEIVVLVGPNGAGKSTLIKTISGLLKPASGTIKFNGARLDNKPADAMPELGIAMIPEGRRLFPEMSVWENLELGAFNSRARKLKTETVQWAFNIFPILKERTKQAAGTLSGGEQQMLAISRGLMAMPKLLLIDEVSLGLSPKLSQNLFKVIKEIRDTKGITVFLVEQNVNMALKVADRGYVLETGHIIAQDKASELLKSEHVKEAYLGLKLVKRDITK